MQAAPALIELRDIRLTVEGREILRGITLSLTEKRVGIIGRNGSGKTSLARVLAGLIQSDGAVRVGGVDVWADRKGALGQIGILFQNPDHQIIFPTVEEEVGFGVRQQGHDAPTAARAALEALAHFGVHDWAERPVAELSQGQKHLVCLISVLAMRPAVIVLDEPFTGLDLPTSQQMTRYLDALDETLVHITHDMGALAAYDRVIWIDEGVVRADGPAKDVLAAYKAGMTQLVEEGGNAVTDQPR